MSETTKRVDVAVVGGGLGGLAAAAYLARSGRSVLVLERTSAVGGRAATHEEHGFRLNLGPHALYAASAGVRVLRELGVPFQGGKPSASGAYAVDGGRKHTLPGGFLSLVTTGLFGLPAKLETARLLASFHKLDARTLHGISVDEFLHGAVRLEDVRRLVRALFRVATYVNDPERLAAGVAVRQLQLALGEGVLYLDGGWQRLVEGLLAAARTAGAEVASGSHVSEIVPADGRWTVRLRWGAEVDAGTVVVAASPEVASGLVDHGAHATLRRLAEVAIPVRAACLDLGLSRLPDPRGRFALGIDHPLYCSVHSAVAQLAPAGGATVHVAKYLPPGRESDPKADESELERLMDLVQPGWRELVVARRFLPAMVVCNGLPTAASGGLPGRPGPEVPGLAGFYLVGDWIGPEGFLADATLASARLAAERITEGEGRKTRAAA
jgi:phytoene dehydrogenase-like protein